MGLFFKLLATTFAPLSTPPRMLLWLGWLLSNLYSTKHGIQRLSRSAWVSTQGWLKRKLWMTVLWIIEDT